MNEFEEDDFLFIKYYVDELVERAFFEIVNNPDEGEEEDGDVADGRIANDLEESLDSIKEFSEPTITCAKRTKPPGRTGPSRRFLKEQKQRALEEEEKKSQELLTIVESSEEEDIKDEVLILQIQF